MPHVAIYNQSYVTVNNRHRIHIALQSILPTCQHEMLESLSEESKHYDSDASSLQEKLNLPHTSPV